MEREVVEEPFASAIPWLPPITEETIAVSAPLRPHTCASARTSNRGVGTEHVGRRGYGT